MQKFIATILLIASTSSYASVRQWSCTYSGHTSEVAFDEATRVLRVTSDNKVTDEGFTIKRTAVGSDLVEYSMGYSNLDYAYSLRFNVEAKGDVELKYCYGCAAYACRAK